MTQQDSSASIGVLLVGHGTRNRAGRAEFSDLVRRVTERMKSFVVRSCYLELAEPTIAGGFVEMQNAGVDGVVVCPVLLFAAGHAKRDIPEAVEVARGAHSFDWIAQAKVLALHEQVLELQAERFDQRVPSRAADPERTLLLVVGRGSLDAEAIAATHQLTEARSRRSPVGHSRTAFYAMASPSLDEAFEEARSLPVDRVVVQPHLLFEGQILEQLRIRVAEANDSVDHQEWIITDHLGPESRLADAIVDRCMQAVTAQAVSGAPSGPSSGAKVAGS